MALHPGTLPHPVSSGLQKACIERELMRSVFASKRPFRVQLGKDEGRVSKDSPTLGVGEGAVDSHIRSTPHPTADFRLQAVAPAESDPSPPSREMG